MGCQMGRDETRRNNSWLTFKYFVSIDSYFSSKLDIPIGISLNLELKNAPFNWLRDTTLN